MKKQSIVIIGLFLFSGKSLSQNCPAGIPSAGNPMCLPPNHTSSPYYQGESSRPVWADRWGAIATDGVQASVGTVVGSKSKEHAEQAAISRCVSSGGSNCEIILTYRNQCAVIVAGDTQHLAQGAGTEEEASAMAVQRCNQIDINCHVYYSACSLPERVW